jgi:hypothetical protein
MASPATAIMSPPDATPATSPAPADGVAGAEKEKENKYRAAFKASKKVIVSWEAAFEVKNGRKAAKDEQTETVQRCYRNCKKISAYFKVKSQRKAKRLDSAEDEAGEEDVPRLSFSGIFGAAAASQSAPETTSSLPSPTSSSNSGTACQDISNLGKAWGKHVQSDALVAKARKGRVSSSVEATMEMGAKLAGQVLMEGGGSATRQSLKKKTRTTIKRPKTFDTLGGDATTPSSLPRGAIHQLFNIILKSRILVLLPVSTLPYVVKVKNHSEIGE